MMIIKFRNVGELIETGNSPLDPSLIHSHGPSPLLWINSSPISVHVPLSVVITFYY
jgi:hypothetical protein